MKAMKHSSLLFAEVLLAFIVTFKTSKALELQGFDLDNTQIHTQSQLTLPVYLSDFYQEARVYFLPDWQSYGSFKDRVQEGQGGDLLAYECMTYGYAAACEWPLVSTGEIRPRQKLTCQKSCICDDSFRYNLSNSSEERWVLGIETCKGNTNVRTPKPCRENYTAGLNDCSGKNNPSGWIYHQDGFSGNEVCGICTARKCGDSEYTAGLNDCSGKAHPEGWIFSKNDYSGDEVCGKCTAKICGTGFTVKLESCSAKIHSDGWKYSSDGYAGDDICGKCTALLCQEGYSSGLSDCEEKSEPYYWKYDANGYNGDAVCGRCQELSCTEKNALCNSGTFNLDYYYADGALRCLMK